MAIAGACCFLTSAIFHSKYIYKKKIQLAKLPRLWLCISVSSTYQSYKASFNQGLKGELISQVLWHNRKNTDLGSNKPEFIILGLPFTCCGILNHVVDFTELNYFYSVK